MYCVKLPYYSNDPIDHGWNYKFIHQITLCCSGEVIYVETKYSDHVLEMPEAVAEWLCELLSAQGLNPEMESV